MKNILIIFLFFLVQTNVYAQGVVLVPDSTYKNISSPPITASAGAGEKRYVIPKQYFPTPGNQEKKLNCVGWALGYGLMSFNNVSSIENNKQSNLNGIQLSPWYIYKSVKSCSTCACGARLDLALEFAKTIGNVPYSDYANPLADCNVPDEKLKKVAVKYRIADYKRVEDELNINEIKSYLVTNTPVVAIIKADKQFKNYKDLAEKSPYVWKFDPNYDYHAIVIVGYDDNINAMKILNSYGESWGSGGYGWISYGSYRSMMMQGFIVIKDASSLPIVASVKWDTGFIAGSSNEDNKLLDISEKDFSISGTIEKIRENRNHYTYSILAKPEILNNIRKVIWKYDHPTFLNKFVTSYAKPNFSNSYDGWGCISTISANIYLLNDSVITIKFDGCRTLKGLPPDILSSPEKIEIVPYVSAKRKLVKNYDFNVELRGIDLIKSQIDSVTYYWNHPSFKNRLTVSKPPGDFSGGYSGWGCIGDVKITIFYRNKKTKILSVNMCKELGWNDVETLVKN